jgi:hypothetical protein
MLIECPQIQGLKVDEALRIKCLELALKTNPSTPSTLIRVADEIFQYISAGKK